MKIRPKHLSYPASSQRDKTAVKRQKWWSQTKFVTLSNGNATFQKANKIEESATVVTLRHLFC